MAQYVRNRLALWGAPCGTIRASIATGEPAHELSKHKWSALLHKENDTRDKAVLQIYLTMFQDLCVLKGRKGGRNWGSYLDLGVTERNPRRKRPSQQAQRCNRGCWSTEGRRGTQAPFRASDGIPPHLQHKSPPGNMCQDNSCDFQNPLQHSLIWLDICNDFLLVPVYPGSHVLVVRKANTKCPGLNFPENTF
jgi:hypothetical protein